MEIQPHKTLVGRTVYMEVGVYSLKYCFRKKREFVHKYCFAAKQYAVVMFCSAENCLPQNISWSTSLRFKETWLELSR